MTEAQLLALISPHLPFLVDELSTTPWCEEGVHRLEPTDDIVYLRDADDVTHGIIRLLPSCRLHATEAWGPEHIIP